VRLTGNLHENQKYTFTPTESTFSYFEATRAYLERHGKPVAFYSDKASVFYVKRRAETAGKGVTQFGRAMYELNIDTFCANSSPAKGRVERAHLTLQDRLVKELRLRGISTIEAANAWAPAFRATYNARFAKPPRSTFDAHRPLRTDENLDAILTWRVRRKVSRSLPNSFHCRQLRAPTSAGVRARRVRATPDQRCQDSHFRLYQSAVLRIRRDSDSCRGQDGNEDVRVAFSRARGSRVRRRQTLRAGSDDVELQGVRKLQHLCP
jgi:hypothetical protein